MKRKLVSLMLVVSMTAAMVAGCGSDDKKTADNNAAGTEKTDDSKEAASGSVYYLNFKPEQDQQWQDLAKAYTMVVLEILSVCFPKIDFVNLHLSGEHAETFHTQAFSSLDWTYSVFLH